jgi:hypothetical protein
MLFKGFFFWFFKPNGSVHNKHFCSLKQMFLLKIGFSGIKNCNTFLDAPSAMNENVRNALFLCNLFKVYFDVIFGYDMFSKLT